MQHVVVVAHPAEESFTMALARAYAAELEALGHRQLTRDLYRMGFDPVLAAAELGPVATVAADVAAAQAELRAADALTVIYPLWWMAMPAMMKGYIDRVFARGFAYQATGGVVRGLLDGKTAVLITISGAPLPVLVDSGKWQAAQVLQDGHVFRSAGFDLLEHLHFDEVTPQMPAETAERHLARVRACARRNFPAGG
jgi:NAD(P)H dehydrogenase (quinone)